jgi:hypothetical protein
LHLGSNVKDAAGDALDGEWTTNASSESGNGTPGGDFNFRFNSNPGDIDANQAVSLAEVSSTRSAVGKKTTNPGYNFRQDFDGNGTIALSEVVGIRPLVGTNIRLWAEPAKSTSAVIQSGLDPVSLAFAMLSRDSEDDESDLDKSATRRIL